MKTVHTQDFRETQKLGQKLAEKLVSGQIICLSGELGSGKTTFAQGILKGLKVAGPYTSPTFVIIKHYHKTWNIKQGTGENKLLHASYSMLHDIYHIDAYRVDEKDILNLGWEEIIAQPDNLIIIEWAERIKKIIPQTAKWINFSWEGEKKRRVVFAESSSF
jgi:tRNA threonylcarbamoyladenosine biosynthesis protein TsaE